MNKFLIDTSILVDYLRGKEQASSLLDKFKEEGLLMISVITQAELYFGCRNENEEITLDNLFATFETVYLYKTILKKASEIKRKYNKNYKCDLIDMLIAASTIVEDAELVTLNIKHFGMIKGLKIKNIE